MNGFVMRLGSGTPYPPRARSSRRPPRPRRRRAPPTPARRPARRAHAPRAPRPPARRRRRRRRRRRLGRCQLTFLGEVGQLTRPASASPQGVMPMVDVVLNHRTATAVRAPRPARGRRTRLARAGAPPTRKPTPDLARDQGLDQLREAFLGRLGCGKGRLEVPAGRPPQVVQPPRPGLGEVGAVLVDVRAAHAERPAATVWALLRPQRALEWLQWC